ncbi:hypothetical protein [Halobiforma nitratireducens]|uniref:hypothetical protein n=1 Tax=Halobiforma nitratireducens TaxID=130048 RepID=UPI001267CA3E|nr:hypothetical protein [Halobiforma nitratireducens]
MVPERYNIDSLQNALQNPSLFVEELNYLLHTRTQKKLFINEHGTGVDVMDKDWDNLILLDACRHDVFKEVNDISGDLQSVVSKGSTSYEFMKENFSGKELHDTVYVTGNGNTEKIKKTMYSST